MAAVKKKLIIDGQILQSEARDRGMGRYSAHFIRTLLASRHGYDEIEIILTKNIVLSAKDKNSLREYFGSVPQAWLDLQVSRGRKLDDVLRHNKAVLNQFIGSRKNQSHEVDYLIPSLFQEPIAALFPEGVNKLLLFYDLIPYLYHKRYEVAMGKDFDNYLRRFKYVFEADKIFAISQTVADDLSVYLGIPSKKIVRVDGAAISSGGPAERPRVQLPEKFILMPTSDDPRKNNLRAVLGFEEFRSNPKNSGYKLIITSKINRIEREHLQMFSPNLIFSGNLSEAQLDWFYENCSAVLFVPEYEGLGLPVLEAVEAGKAVACSSISVFKEISDNAFCYCDYENPTSISQALEKAIKLNPDKTIYKKIRAYYSWPKTIERFTEGTAIEKLQPLPKKYKIAVFSPTPNGYSAIGKVVSESHYVLSEQFEIDYYIESGLQDAKTRPDFLQYVASTYPAEAFSVQRYMAYDAVFYHVGNGDYHLESIKSALYLPGYMIVHDTNLKEAYRVLSEQGMMPAERIRLEEMLDKQPAANRQTGLTTLVNRQLGIVTHSQYAKTAVQDVLAAPAPMLKANLPAAVPQQGSSRQHSQVSVGLAGIIADIKGIEIIEQIASDSSFNHCQIKLFGFSHASQKTLNRLNSYENVTAITALSDFEFQNNLNRLDVYINYRLGYNGETSLSTIEAMRSGAVVIVRDIGWYSELPDAAVVKASSPAEAIQRLSELVTDKQRRDIISREAKKYIADNFSHESYANSLKEIINMDKNNNPNAALAKSLMANEIRNLRQMMARLKKLSLI